MRRFVKVSVDRKLYTNGASFYLPTSQGTIGMNVDESYTVIPDPHHYNRQQYHNASDNLGGWHFIDTGKTVTNQISGSKKVWAYPPVRRIYFKGEFLVESIEKQEILVTEEVEDDSDEWTDDPFKKTK